MESRPLLLVGSLAYSCSLLVMLLGCPSSPAALPSPGPGSEQAVLQGGLSLHLPSPAASSVYAVWVPDTSAPHTLNEYKNVSSIG